MKIQAVLFEKSRFSTAEARRWLAMHDLEPLKHVHTTAEYHRYRILQPDNRKQYRTVWATDGVKFILQM